MSDNHSLFGHSLGKRKYVSPWALGSVLFVTRNEPADPATIALHTPSTDSKLRIFTNVRMAVITKPQSDSQSA